MKTYLDYNNLKIDKYLITIVNYKNKTFFILGPTHRSFE